jgi:hypothetical protein
MIYATTMWWATSKKSFKAVNGTLDGTKLID